MTTPQYLTSAREVGAFVMFNDTRAEVQALSDGVRLLLPGDAGQLVLQWQPGGSLLFRMPVAQVAPSRFGAVMQLVSSINATLEILGFVLSTETGYVEFRTALVPDASGRVDAHTVGRLVVTVQETVQMFAPHVAETITEVAPEVPSWFGE